MSRIALALAALLAVGVLALACGDDDENDSGNSSTPAASPSPGGTGETTSTPAPTEDDDPTPTEQPSGPAEEVRNLLQDWLNGVNQKVTYHYKSDFGGKPDGVYTIYYLDGASRHDWLNEGAGFGVTVTTITNGDEAYVCNLSETNSLCRSTTPEDAIQTRVAFLIIPTTIQGIIEGIDDMAVTELPQDEVAGEQASCYEIRSTGRITEGHAGSETLKFCFSDTGALLLIDHVVEFDDESLPDDHLTLVAEELAQPVPADFDPPARVHES